jgi:hypothetical protein
MTIFQAKQLDPKMEARKRMFKRAAIVIIVLGIIAAPLLYSFRNWPEEHAVDKFLSTLEKKDYQQAFAIWNADPDWQQHAERYQNYPFGQFQLDWGPTGDYGEIKSHKIYGAATPHSKIANVTGVVVAAQINGRAEPACLWVEKKTHAISFSHLPCTAS